MVTKYKIVIKRTREGDRERGWEEKERGGLVNDILINELAHQWAEPFQRNKCCQQLIRRTDKSKLGNQVSKAGPDNFIAFECRKNGTIVNLGPLPGVTEWPGLEHLDHRKGVVGAPPPPARYRPHRLSDRDRHRSTDTLLYSTTQ